VSKKNPLAARAAEKKRGVFLRLKGYERAVGKALQEGRGTSPMLSKDVSRSKISRGPWGQERE